MLMIKISSMQTNVDAQLNMWKVDNRTFFDIPINLFELIGVFKSFGLTQRVDITLLLRSQIQSVNYQLCSKNYPPDTLSFPPDMPEEPAVVLLCPQEINLYCIVNHVPEKVRWAHIIVHSVLHTYGYDHYKDDDFKKMLSLEREILSHIEDFSTYELTDAYTYCLKPQK